MFLGQPSSSSALDLYCFPYAGGGASVFSRWMREEHRAFDLFAFQSPGKGSRFRERPHIGMDVMVASAAHTLLARIDERRPYALFGHSMGAYVAYELVRALPQYLQPRLLIVSGCRAPHMRPARKEKPYAAMSDEEFLGVLRRYNGTPPEILADRRLLELLLPAVRADFNTFESYSIAATDRVVDVPICCFGGREDVILEAELAGWRELTTGDFDLEMLAGEHFFIHSHSQLLLDCVSRRIDAVLKKRLLTEVTVIDAPRMRSDRHRQAEAQEDLVIVEGPAATA